MTESRQLLYRDYRGISDFTPTPSSGHWITFVTKTLIARYCNQSGAAKSDANSKSTIQTTVSATKSNVFYNLHFNLRSNIFEHLRFLSCLSFKCVVYIKTLAQFQVPNYKNYIIIDTVTLCLTLYQPKNSLRSLSLLNHDLPYKWYNK